METRYFVSYAINTFHEDRVAKIGNMETVVDGLLTDIDQVRKIEREIASSEGVGTVLVKVIDYKQLPEKPRIQPE